MKFKHVLAIALLVIIIVSGCSNDTITGRVVQKDDTIKIGATLFLSNNDLSFLAEAMQQGIDIAVEEVNSQGGVLGKKIEVVYEDDQFDSKLSVSAAKKLTSIDKVDAALTGLVNTAKASGPVFEKAEIPLVVLWDVNKELEKIGDFVYGIGFSTEEAGQKMAQLLTKKGAKDVAVIRHQDEWSQLISDSFVEEFENLGGKITIDESLRLGETDFRTVLLKAKNADAFFAPLVFDLDILFKQAVELGYEGIMTTGDGMTQEVVELAEGAAEGVYFTQVDAEGKKFEKLRKSFIAKYGSDSDLIIFSALGYDGIMILVEAMEIAGSDDSIATHNALYKIKGFKGASGISTMSSKGSAPKQEVIFFVENGEVVKT